MRHQCREWGFAQTLAVPLLHEREKLKLGIQLAQAAFGRSDQIGESLALFSAKTASVGMPRLSRMSDYAASSVTVALKAPSSMRHESEPPDRLTRKLIRSSTAEFKALKSFEISGSLMKLL